MSQEKRQRPFVDVGGFKNFWPMKRFFLTNERRWRTTLSANERWRTNVRNLCAHIFFSNSIKIASYAEGPPSLDGLCVLGLSTFPPIFIMFGCLTLLDGASFSLFHCLSYFFSDERWRWRTTTLSANERWRRMQEISAHTFFFAPKWATIFWDPCLQSACNLPKPPFSIFSR